VEAKAQAVYDEGAKCGLSLDATAKSGSTYTVKVKLGIGKEALSGSYKIDGLLMKKVDISPAGVATDASGKWFGQMNYYYNTAGHPFYKRGTAFTTSSGSTVYVITEYDHVHVHMQSFSTTVDAAKLAAGSLSEYSFSVDIPYGDPSEWYFITSVNKGGLAPQTMNTQKVEFGATAALILAGGMQSCTPDEPNNTSNTAPESYTQKVLLEYFSGAWCQYCPDGRVVAEKLVTKFGDNKFYPVTYHIGDYLENPDGVATSQALNVAGYPTGAISRVGGAVNRTQWEAKAQAVYDEGAKCGLSLDATARLCSCV